MKRSNFIKALAFLPFIKPPQVEAKPKAETPRRVWTEQDIMGGLYITRCSSANIKTITFQMGYNFAMGSRMEYETYVLNSVADGWSHGNVDMLKFDLRIGYTKRGLVEFLNSDRCGYRPTTREEMHQIIDMLPKNFLEQSSYVSNVPIHDLSGRYRKPWK